MAIVLGIDYGNKKVGFAVGQTVTKTAQPLQIIKQDGNFWRQVNKLIKEWQPQKIVVGMPLLADGKPHPLEENIILFIEKLTQNQSLEIHRMNEAYTSTEARYYSTSNELDAHAAAIILESWLQTDGS